MGDLTEGFFCWTLSARDGVAASVREEASLPEAEAQEILRHWKQKFGASVSLFYLGTCHRVEVYGHGMEPEELLTAWEGRKKTVLAAARLKRGPNALRHLIRVAASLESEVLGETQITGQVKSAAELARTSGNLSGALDWLIQQALRVTKKIRSSTSLGEGIVSVAHVAVDGLQDVFEDFDGKSALVVGAGPMALQALQRLRHRGMNQITWVNRTQARIQGHDLSAYCRIEDFARLSELVWEHEVTIAATSSEEPILRIEGLQAQQKNARKNRRTSPAPRVLLDLGLPRNVDERIHGFSGFYVRNVDEFSNRIEENSKQRQAAVNAAEEILESELVELLKLSEARERGPLVGELMEILQSLQNAQCLHLKLEKTEDFEYVARAINSKLLHKLIEELNRSGEPLATQVLESLVKAWRQPDQWLKNDPQAENPPEKKPPKAKLVRLR